MSGDCDDHNDQTIDDHYSSGVCSGNNNVEGQTCSDLNTQTIDDTYHNGIYSSINGVPSCPADWTWTSTFTGTLNSQYGNMYYIWKDITSYTGDSNNNISGVRCVK